MRKLKVSIACPGRFHVGDLARELERLGNNVAFHSLVPPSRLVPVRIPRKIQHCHLASVWLWVALQRYGRLSVVAADWNSRKILCGLDRSLSQIKDPGDVFIGMSGLCLKSLSAAKKRGAKVIVERGSCHILSQRQILDRLPSRQRDSSSVPDWMIERELEGYELADVISIPSKHVEDSFIEHGIRRDKLFRNPYGVDLSAFFPVEGAVQSHDVITTGSWCYRKGCDVLAEAVLKRLRLKLLHVGPIGDCPLPVNEAFTHIDSVPQAALRGYYASAKVFAMPSEEEGLSMVQAQALACGLPIIGSTRSGSFDLSEMLKIGAPVIQSVEPGNIDALVYAIQNAISLKQNFASAGISVGENRDFLDWSAYGIRYHQFLQNL